MKLETKMASLGLGVVLAFAQGGAAAAKAPASSSDAMKPAK